MPRLPDPTTSRAFVTDYCGGSSETGVASCYDVLTGAFTSGGIERNITRRLALQSEFGPGELLGFAAGIYLRCTGCAHSLAVG